MWDTDRLYEIKQKNNNSFGCDLGDGYACFITKLISGDWMISKLNIQDKDVFRITIPSNASEDEFKNVLNDMLIAK